MLGLSGGPLNLMADHETVWKKIQRTGIPSEAISLNKESAVKRISVMNCILGF